MHKVIVSFTLILLILLLVFTDITAQRQNQVVKDLKTTWKTYNEPSGYFVPFINNGNYKAIYCELDLSPYKKFNLELRVPAKHSIYINNKFVHLSTELEIIVWPIDSLVKVYKAPEFILTIFSTDLNPDIVDSYIAKKEGDRSNQLDSLLTWYFRESGYGMNVLTLSSFIILALIVIYRTTSYRLFTEYFSISKAIMVRQRFDLVGAHSPLSPVTLLFVMLYALMVGATVLHLRLINLWTFESLGWFELSNTPLLYGIQVTFIAFLLMFLKYVLTIIVAGIYNFQKFSETHYFAYLRISLISMLVVLGISIVMSIIPDQWVGGAWFVGRFLLTILLLLRLLYMGLILNNKYNLSKIHLFTYLCSSEIIPLCLFTKSLLG